jgi:hypothetical protein
VRINVKFSARPARTIYLIGKTGPKYESRYENPSSSGIRAAPVSEEAVRAKLGLPPKVMCDIDMITDYHIDVTLLKRSGDIYSTKVIVSYGCCRDLQPNRCRIRQQRHHVCILLTHLRDTVLEHKFQWVT